MHTAPLAPAQQRRRRALAIGVLAALGGLAASAPWSVPALRQVLSGDAPVALEPDVCIVAPPTPYDPASGLAPTAARAVPADARCPVCGMFPARSPQWAAQVIFSNGDAQFFDSPLSLFQYLHDMARYSPGRSAHDVAASYVSDSAVPGQWLAAEGAFYVHGSDARGPMRAGNLPAFATPAAAQEFAARRGGKVLAFAQISPALLAQLAGSKGHAGHG